VAINRFGDSVQSVDGNGGVIVLVPDSPRLLKNKELITSATVLSFEW
jgi:hypothetical protein